MIDVIQTIIKLCRYSQPTPEVHRYSGPLRSCTHLLIARLEKIDAADKVGRVSDAAREEGTEKLQLQGKLLSEMVKRWPTGHLAKQVYLFIPLARYSHCNR